MERNIIKIDEAGLKDDLKTLIRGTVEDTLNAMLDEEAASLCNAEKHERSDSRKNYRAGTTTGNCSRERENSTSPSRNCVWPRSRPPS